MAVSLCYGLISTLLVNGVETVAAGSGIPEVKGYLNGTNYLPVLSQIRVALFAARTLNATGQYRVTLSLR